MRPFGADTELGAAPHVLGLRPAGRRIVNAHIEQVHAGGVLGVEPADIGQRAPGLDYYGDTVQLVVTRVKDVPAQTAAPKCLSNAFTSSPAIT
jgi:hypothetical protein